MRGFHLFMKIKFVNVSKERAKEMTEAVGSIQLRMVDKLSYLIKDNALETWNNIKSQFDVSGPTAIFVDFRYVINFKFDEKKDPSVQVAELNTELFWQIRQ